MRRSDSQYMFTHYPEGCDEDTLAASVAKSLEVLFSDDICYNIQPTERGAHYSFMPFEYAGYVSITFSNQAAQELTKNSKTLDQYCKLTAQSLYKTFLKSNIQLRD